MMTIDQRVLTSTLCGKVRWLKLSLENKLARRTLITGVKGQTRIICLNSLDFYVGNQIYGAIRDAVKLEIVK